MSPTTNLFLRLLSTIPASVGAWALTATAICVLRVKGPRLRSALWILAVVDTLIAVGHWNGAIVLVFRPVLADRFATQWVSPFAGWALAGWIIITSVLLLRRARAVLRTAQAAENIYRLYGLRRTDDPRHSRVRIAVPPGDGTPFVAGITRPLVILPRDYWTRLREDERTAVLAHEMAHVDRRDPFMKLAVAVASDLLWPAVFLRVMASRLDDCLEQAADAAAVRQGVSRLALAHAIVEAVSSSKVPRGSLAFRSNGPQATQRLAALGRRVPRWKTMAQVAILVIALPWRPGSGSAVLGPTEATQTLAAVGLLWRWDPLQPDLAPALARPVGGDRAVDYSLEPVVEQPMRVGGVK